ncbi:MAG: TonB-dependent receptor [Pseudoxanthomonas sp.]
MLAVVAAMLAAAAQAQDSTQNKATATDATNLDTVKVEGQHVQVESGALGQRAVLDTPFSIKLIDSEDIRDRQVDSLQDLFANESSVLVRSATYGGHGDNLQVRGLSLDYTASFKIDGLGAGLYNPELPYEIFERVELLKGASGFLYGFGAPGGIVNYITKKPTDERLLSLSAGYRSDGIYSVDADLGGRSADQRFGYRLNAVREDGDTYIDGGKIDRSTVALAVDARLTDNLTWTASAFNNQRDLLPGSAGYLGLWAYEGDTSVLPRKYAVSNNLAIDGSFEDTRSWQGRTGLQWQIGEDWSLRAEYSHFEQISRWAKSFADLLDADGTYAAGIYDQSIRFDYNSIQALVEGRFDTGPVRHQVVAGISREASASARAAESVWEDLGYGNIYQSGNGLSYHSPLSGSPGVADRYAQKAVFVSDTVTFSPRWSALIGLRYSDYAQWGGNPWVGDYKDEVTTPTVAVIYKPRPDISVYASYVEALEGGSIVGDDYENRGELLPPLESRQYEAGVKLERGAWSGTAAVFRIERGAEYPNDANYYVQDGETRYDGVELEGRWRSTTGFSLGGGATWLDATYQNTGDAALQGKPVEAVPEFQANLRAGFQFSSVPGLSAYAGLRYTGKQLLEPYGVWTSVPAYTLVDAGGAYRAQVRGHGLTFRVGLTNLTDRSYWTTDGWGSLRIGEPRSVALSVQFEL